MVDPGTLRHKTPTKQKIGVKGTEQHLVVLRVYGVNSQGLIIGQKEIGLALLMNRVVAQADGTITG